MLPSGLCLPVGATGPAQSGTTSHERLQILREPEIKKKKKKKGFWVSFLKSLNMRTKNRQPRMPCANPNPRPSQEKQLGFSTRALGTCRKRDQEHGSLSEVHWPGSLCSASPRAGTTPVCKAPALFPLPQVPSGQTSPAEQGSWTTGPGRRWARAPSAGPGLVTGSRYRIA